MEQLNQRILQLKYKIKEREWLQNQVNKLVDLQRQLEIKKNSLKEHLQKEEIDVEKLQGISIRNFIHMLKGDKDDMLQKEKSEALAAKLKYDEVCNEFQNISDEIRALSSKISELQYLDNEYIKSIEEKEALIKSQGIGASHELSSVIEELSSLKLREKELGEALSAGRELQDSLSLVQDSLQSAHNWGMWDMFGGGFFSTMAKHSSIDEAKGHIDNAQSLLRRFHSELEDVGGSVDINIEIGSFLTFADYFFDGIFADWAVQSKIDEAREKVEDTIYRVNAIVLKLDEELSYIKRKIKTLYEKKLYIIEQA